MRAVVQRVKSASVTIEGICKSTIHSGLLIYLGIALEDTGKDVQWMAEKVATLRIFEDDAGKMNLSLQDVGGEAMVISQFTLFADARKGRRPSYSGASSPDVALIYYNSFVSTLQEKIQNVATGEFQKNMQVNYTNDGPVTILLDSKKVF